MIAKSKMNRPFTKWLRDYRARHRRISAAKLSEDLVRLGVSATPGQVSTWFTGRCTPSAAQCDALAVALGAPPAELRRLAALQRAGEDAQELVADTTTAAIAERDARIRELEADLLVKTQMLYGMASEVQRGEVPRRFYSVEGGSIRNMAIGARPPMEHPRATHAALPAEMIPPRFRIRPPATMDYLVSLLAQLQTQEQADCLSGFADQTERILWRPSLAGDVERIDGKPHRGS